jgi:regulator of cell morphogenesis and NO signaling
VLHKFIDDYQKEVTDHFDYEEREVFPYIQRLQQGQGPVEYIADSFLDSHSDLVESLSDLPQILYKYLPGNCMVEELNELVFSILQLSSDLEKHALLEEKVLMPYVAEMERRLR